MPRARRVLTCALTASLPPRSGPGPRPSPRPLRPRPSLLVALPVAGSQLILPCGRRWCSALAVLPVRARLPVPVRNRCGPLDGERRTAVPAGPGRGRPVRPPAGGAVAPEEGRGDATAGAAGPGGWPRAGPGRAGRWPVTSHPPARVGRCAPAADALCGAARGAARGVRPGAAPSGRAGGVTSGPGPPTRAARSRGVARRVAGADPGEPGGAVHGGRVPGGPPPVAGARTGDGAGPAARAAAGSRRTGGSSLRPGTRVRAVTPRSSGGACAGELAGGIGVPEFPRGVRRAGAGEPVSSR